MRWTEGLLNLLYPPRCPICDGIREADMDLVCFSCRDQLLGDKKETIHCSKCGKFLTDADREYCEDCMKKQHFFDQGFGALPYSGWARESVLRFKFQRRQEYRKFFGRLMVQESLFLMKKWRPQVIIPVPMYISKKKRRGYDQAELLAREVGFALGIPVREDLVFRLSDTKPQKELDPEMRRKNLRKAFSVDGDILQYKRILLIDDIYTTGSTVDAIGEQIKKQTDAKVYVLTLCTGSGN